MNKPTEASAEAIASSVHAHEAKLSNAAKERAVINEFLADKTSPFARIPLAQGRSFESHRGRR